MTNGVKILAESLIIRKIQYIVINYINLFVFDDEIEMKNRSTIQTLTFVQTNPDHLYMKLNMKLVVVHAIIHCLGWKILAPCKNFSWLLTFKTGTWKWHLAIFLAPTFWEPEQPLYIYCSFGPLASMHQLQTITCCSTLWWSQGRSCFQESIKEWVW